MTDPDVRNEIMTATYEALCEHGYTDLTAQDIADRTDKSKSLLFYHYDSKEDLVVDFLEYLLEVIDDRVAEIDSLEPAERLSVFVDWFLYGSEGSDQQSFHTAMLELRTQAPYNDRYREQLRRSDDRLRAALEGILEDGIDAGQFVDHDPERTAALLIAAIDGARIRQLTLERDEYLAEVRTALVARIFDELLADDVEFSAERPSTSASKPDRTPDGDRFESDRET
ncbi:TetR/AcrR family transcriptional regulator [Natrarchaeobius chitinivorans]|uniref:TetR family transcriptional regulator n=1 Tax=Natrarchaeobius chitinivorans TaxID=1679083 RepID=A0A3N6MFW0_NATCH|nr:TetR/AcrR family transcriptional regulator [Natrarchaeobius chitinivorans]RQG94481.1 TetR family transcriptional regulator [Natrarchaeobius chitinivorans]